MYSLYKRFVAFFLHQISHFRSWSITTTVLKHEKANEWPRKPVALRGEDATHTAGQLGTFEPWNTANVWTPKKKGRDQIICLEENVKKILAEHNGFKICDRSSQASCKWAFPTFCEPKFVYLPVWSSVSKGHKFVAGSSNLGGESSAHIRWQSTEDCLLPFLFTGTSIWLESLPLCLSKRISIASTVILLPLHLFQVMIWVNKLYAKLLKDRNRYSNPLVN